MKYKIEWFKSSLNVRYSDYCPRECDSVSYFVSTRSLSNQFSMNSSFIQAYYRTLVYAVISQYPSLSLLDLISFIGGLTGLFLGASFLSFVEIFEMINGVIFHLIEAVLGNFCIN